MSDYRVTHLEEIEERSDGRSPWRAVRHHFGITAFGVNAWTAQDAGDRLINEHDEAGEEDEQEELYLVHTGRARFELNGETVDAPTGTLVYARPGVRRTAFAEEPGTTVLAVGGRPGHAYEAFGWEVWSPYHSLYQEGRYAEAADRARAEVEASPYAGPLYNLACCEALAGRSEEAILHLRAAIEASSSDRFRKLAAEDSDFDPIRDEPDFQELVG
jgi:tetratricopeptide (TPR) repeat protein